MKSDFVNKRKEGIEPYEIDSKLAISMIQNMLNTPLESIFSIGDIKNYDLTFAKGTFNYHQCSKCSEPVYETGIRVKDNKYICISCGN